jgi:signal transduction histidine kinase
VTVRGEADRLRQVMDNLLSNAIRYSPDATAIDVVIDQPPDEDLKGAVRVSVVDRGPGLSPLDAAHVFDRLYRTDQARSRVDGGAGLGLAIVRFNVEAHGGQVFVRSRPGEGSAFGSRFRHHHLGDVSAAGGVELERMDP